MKKLIIANWKMNPASLKEAKALFDATKKNTAKLKKVETVICPPFVYLAAFGSFGFARASGSGTRLSKSQAVSVGSQNCFYSDKGAFTGEVSPVMLKSIGVKYVIVGHSERRAMGETDEMINKKIKSALACGLKVIFCVGEKERNVDGEYLNVVKKQLQIGLAGADKKMLKNLFVAYEPVWAISTNRSASGGKAVEDSPDSFLRMSLFIRKVLFEMFGNAWQHSTPVLYGGSVNAQNAEGFLKAGLAAGLLVGGKSLDKKEFGEILKIGEMA